MNHTAIRKQDESTIRVALALLEKSITLHELTYTQMLQNLRGLRTMEQSFASASGSSEEAKRVKPSIDIFQEQCDRQRARLEKFRQRQDGLIQQIQKINFLN
jgi:hypothetical protein